MRVLWFFPLTFLAGIHGLEVFAPYLCAFLAIVHLSRTAARARNARRIRVIAD